MAYVHFQPWIGKDYETGGIFKKKILVLGESVYCGEHCRPCEDCPQFTNDCVNTYVKNNVYDESGAFKKWTNTYNKFESALVGERVAVEARQQVWDSIAFYTYFQTALDEARQPLGGDMEFERAAECLMQILDKLQPLGVIVWGSRLWQCLPYEGWVQTPAICNQGKQSETGYYLVNDKKYPFMRINHPSSGFSWDVWNLNIRQFIETL